MAKAGEGIMNELMLNIIGVGFVYLIIGTILFIIIKLAIWFAKRSEDEKSVQK